MGFRLAAQAGIICCRLTRPAKQDAASGALAGNVIPMRRKCLTEEEFQAIESRCAAATKAPWESYVEGRDHSGGSDFIRTGGLDDDSPDIELLGATKEDQDFIAAARQDIPLLIAEIKRLKSIIQKV